jgi:ferric-dicitrate binding protein FerR (iron transport regulator)
MKDPGSFGGFFLFACHMGKYAKMNGQIEKYFREEELKESEKLALLESIASDPEGKKLYIIYKNISGLLSLSDKLDDRKESFRGYERFLDRLRRRKMYRLARQFLRVAAACALLVTVTYWLTLRSVDKPVTAETINTLYVPAGQRVKVTLQDGTDVWLNAKTTLSYPAVFGDSERRVQVEGEAFFDIAEDSKRPFIVSACNVNMKALGTRFNVYNYPGESSVRASLIEGKLKVYLPHAEENAVILNANEEVTVEGERMEKKMIVYADYFLWKDGIYSFHNELLGDLLKKLELYYDVKIVVEDPSISKWEYTGKFRQREGIDEIIRMIRKIHRFKVEKDEENNIFTLK